MRVILQVPDIGDILYEESYWTGKKTVSINGRTYQKASKTTYVYMDGEKEHYITLNGSFLSGVSVTFGNGVTVQITEKPAWYEWLLSGAGFLFILIWGNIPLSAEIFPVISGAIGGGIAAVFAIFSLMLIRDKKEIWKKVLIAVAFFAVTVLICHLLGKALLDALNNITIE
jgi:hypothetical protein